MTRLTDKAIRALKATVGERMLADGNNLYLRVRPDGAPKAWMFRYSLSGKARKTQIGTFPLLSLAGAREEAVKLSALCAQGLDPIEERDRNREARRADVAAQAARLTVSKLFDRWQEIDLVRRKDGGKEIRRMFVKDVLPQLGNLPVEEVRKGHITGVTDALLARGVTRSAKLMLALLRQMFRFAVDRDILEFDPSASIRKAKIGGRETERDRVLAEDEIKALCVQLPNANLPNGVNNAIWIAIATCCRIGELTRARWEHIDFAKGNWRIPPENSKNGKPHTVFLSEFALHQFVAQKKIAEQAYAIKREKDDEAIVFPWIFPSRNGETPINPKVITKQIGDRQRLGKEPLMKRTGMDRANSLVLTGGRWTPHDLRRTGATMMVALGVLPEVAERCLNHTEQNRMKRTYQQHGYEVEMGAAWRLLGERLELLNRSDLDKVVRLGKRNTRLA
jgi:integrase